MSQEAINLLVFLVVVAARFAIPLAIPRFPLPAIVACLIIDGVDQTSFLLSPDGVSNRKYLYYWLTNVFSGLRVGEWKFMIASSSDDDRDCLNLGGFTGVTQKYSHGRLYNLYLDPKEQHSYLIRKLAYLDSFTSGIAAHVGSFVSHPPKQPIAAMS